MNKRKELILNLTQEEQELSDSFDQGEWKSVVNVKEEKIKARKAAARYFRKDTRI